MAHVRIRLRTIVEKRQAIGVAIYALVATHVMYAQAPRFAVTSEQVITAMKAHAWPVDGVQIQLAAAMTASVADPRLEIRTLSMLTPRTAHLRIVCAMRGACLPFFATVVWPESAGPVSLRAEQGVARGGVRTSAKMEAGHDLASVLKAGTPATLVLEGERIHIRLDVVCLESGTTGDRVRVTTRDHKQAYVAEIVTPTMLRGSLSR